MKTRPLAHVSSLGPFGFHTLFITSHLVSIHRDQISLTLLDQVIHKCFGGHVLPPRNFMLDFCYFIPEIDLLSLEISVPDLTH
jgi:hypothetical protein